MADWGLIGTFRGSYPFPAGLYETLPTLTNVTVPSATVESSSCNAVPSTYQYIVHTAYTCPASFFDVALLVDMTVKNYVTPPTLNMSGYDTVNSCWVYWTNVDPTAIPAITTPAMSSWSNITLVHKI